MSPSNSQPLWTPVFVLLCLAQFLGYAQHSILQPTLPLYVTHLGASPFVVGLVLASFAITSMLLRPFVGYWSDRWSEVGVMICGLIIQGASVGLCFLPFVATILLSNGCRGVGWACLNSGGYAILAHHAPAARRGEASGYYSGVQGSAVILLPALALWLIDAPFAGFRGVFWVSMTLAAVGALISLRLPGQERAPSFVAQHGQTSSWLRQVLTLPDKDVLLASGLLFGLQISLPAIAGFLVLYARQIGIENFGWYYVASGTTNIIARPLLGWASDKLGRGAAIAAGFALEALALCLIVSASTLGAMMLSGVVYMTGSAMGSAATLAYALDRADQARRGQTMATYSMAYPSSAFVGALLTGAVIEVAGYFWMFLIVAALNIPGLIVTWKNWSNLK